MNIDAKILNRRCVNQILEHIQKIGYRDKWASSQSLLWASHPN